MDIIVLKIGGSCLTYKKEGVAKVRQGFLTRLVSEVKRSQKKNKFLLVIVHGGGSVTHPLLDKYKIAEKLKTGSLVNDGDKLAACKIHWAMNMLNKKVVRAFLEGGIPAWPIQTSALFSFSGRKLRKYDSETIRLAIAKGYVPILHGDLCIDKKIASCICSGDLVSALLAKELGAKKLLFASDVDGVFSSDPRYKKNQEFIKYLDKKQIKLFDQSAGAADHSGGMMTKIDYIDKNCRKMEVVIFNGLKKGNFERAFFGEKVGTRVNL